MSPKPLAYGGQALIEGVMMAGGPAYAMAARTEDGYIVYKNGVRKSLRDRCKIWGWPFLRGFASLFESMAVGFGSLSWSAQQAGEEEEKLSFKEIFLTILVAVVIAVLLFIALPVFVASFSLPYVGYFGRSLLEGLMRICLFLGYVLLLRRLKDMKRVFAYHGAEHKTIKTLESGNSLTVENARVYSTIHPRCGTSFIMMSLILMIVVFTFVGNVSVVGRILIKLLMMPVIVGLAYEIYRLPLKFPHNPVVRALVAPGLALQRLTTAEPDDQMLEVAIASLMKVPGFTAPAGSVLPDKVVTEEELACRRKEAARPPEKAREEEDNAGKAFCFSGKI